MCGIVGYIGTKKAKQVILEGLTKLEYRGYDSAGLSLYDEQRRRFELFKEVGRVSELILSVKNKQESHIGMGHTRWATHGKVNQINAHPHVSHSGRFMIVHNGIVDNADALKEQYLEHVEFISETDTEIIAELIETFSLNLNVENAIVTTLKLLEGSYALLILDQHNPDIIYAAKHKSPLLIGRGQHGNTVASDMLAFDEETYDFFPLEDETFSMITKDKVRFFDFQLRPILMDRYPLSDQRYDASKGIFEHYMLKEIKEQPEVLKRLMTTYIKEDQLSFDAKLLDEMKQSDRLYIIAAGTSMHAGLIGKRYFEALSDLYAEVHIASEFAYSMPKLSKHPFFIFITQSGETADLRACLVALKKKDYPILTLTNVMTSTLAREATFKLDVCAGPEIAVASTKAYVAQVGTLLMLAHALSDQNYAIKEHFNRLIVAMEHVLSEEKISTVIEHLTTKRNCFYIGRGYDYDLSLEAALKLKEVSYIQTEGFASGELKHGTIALIEEGTPVIGLISSKALSSHTRNGLKEVEARGASTCIITFESLQEKGDHIVLPDVDQYMRPMLLVVPTQLISYYAALHRGLDIDKPRNLAKSVTVE